MLDESPREPVGQAILRDPQRGDWIVIIQDGKRQKITVASVEPEKVVVHIEEEGEPLKWDGFTPPGEFANWARQFQIIETSR